MSSKSRHRQRQLAFQTLYALDFGNVATAADLEALYERTRAAVKAEASDLSPSDEARIAKEREVSAEAGSGTAGAAAPEAAPVQEAPASGRDTQDLAWEIVYHVWRLKDELDDIVRPNSNRPLERVGRTEMTILRMGTYELVKPQRDDVKVVLNECVLLAREFGEDPSYQFVNGVLHGVARRVSEQGLGLESLLPEYVARSLS